MKQQLNNWILAITSVLLISCEKVIDVQLHESDAKYVIEGFITDKDGTAKVKITQTSNFSGLNNFPPVSGATVVISNGEDEVRLSEKAAGIYEGEMTGEPGRTYSLTVKITDEIFTALSIMPEPVPVGEVYITQMDMMGDDTKQVNVVFNDPADKTNNYRFVQFINDEKTKTIYPRNDELTNGRKVTVTLFDHHTEIKPADVVRVEIHSIDESMYKYWYTLSQSATGETDSASPANPQSNITGGALGYFSAHAVTEKAITVQAE